MTDVAKSAPSAPDSSIPADASESASKPTKSASKKRLNMEPLYYLYLGVLAAVGAQLVYRDDRTLRSLLPKGAQLALQTWDPRFLDRIVFLVVWTMAWFLAVCLVPAARRGLLRSVRTNYRAQRDEVVDGVRDAWRSRRVIAFQILCIVAVLCGSLVVWRQVVTRSNSESPVVVVLSGSMEPAFYRGDLLFLSNSYEEPIVPGEIVVFKIPGRDIPIVHRVMQIHTPEDPGKPVMILTKGDNNRVHDRGLYAPGQTWLNREHIIGRARFFLPYVGSVTIVLNDNPVVKWGLIIGIVGLMIVNREL